MCYKKNNCIYRRKKIMQCLCPRKKCCRQIELTRVTKSSCAVFFLQTIAGFANRTILMVALAKYDVKYSQKLPSKSVIFFSVFLFKNTCGKKPPPCQNRATCQSGFTYKGYRCLCTPGFEGEHCEKGTSNV